MTIAPVRFGMPLSKGAHKELRRQREQEQALLTTDFEQRLADAESLAEIDRAPWPRNTEWSDDEYRFREYVKLETELLERQRVLKQGKDKLTQRELRGRDAALKTAEELLPRIHARQRELMQDFSVAALDRMTTWLQGNARFQTQTDLELTRLFHTRCNPWAR